MEAELSWLPVCDDVPFHPTTLLLYSLPVRLSCTCILLKERMLWASVLWLPDSAGPTGPAPNTFCSLFYTQVNLSFKPELLLLRLLIPQEGCCSVEKKQPLCCCLFLQAQWAHKACTLPCRPVGVWTLCCLLLGKGRVTQSHSWDPVIWPWEWV